MMEKVNTGQRFLDSSGSLRTRNLTQPSDILDELEDGKVRIVAESLWQVSDLAPHATKRCPIAQVLPQDADGALLQR